MGASKDFISSQFVEKHHLKINEGSAGTSVVELADGTQCESRKSITNMELQLYSWKEYRNQMEVLPLQKYDAILGKP